MIDGDRNVLKTPLGDLPRYRTRQPSHGLTRISWRREHRESRYRPLAHFTPEHQHTQRAPRKERAGARALSALLTNDLYSPILYSLEISYSHQRKDSPCRALFWIRSGERRFAGSTVSPATNTSSSKSRSRNPSNTSGPKSAT
jgi:hypothetical protein